MDIWSSRFLQKKCEGSGEEAVNSSGCCFCGASTDWLHRSRKIDTRATSTIPSQSPDNGTSCLLGFTHLIRYLSTKCDAFNPSRMFTLRSENIKGLRGLPRCSARFYWLWSELLIQPFCQLTLICRAVALKCGARRGKRRFFADFNLAVDTRGIQPTGTIHRPLNNTHRMGLVTESEWRGQSENRHWRCSEAGAWEESPIGLEGASHHPARSKEWS